MAGRYIVGLDLGQARDYTALCVAECLRVGALPSGYRPAANFRNAWHRSKYDGEERLTADPRPLTYHMRHLERVPLGTPYPTVVARVVEMMATPPLSGDTPLVVDATGVGRAITDLFGAGGLCTHAITIHGGDEVIRAGPRHEKVPKRELVGTLVMLFQTERLKVAAGLEHAGTLVQELLNFRVKVDLRTAHDSYEAWREGVHDDLVLAVALACWHGEHQPQGFYVY